MRLNDVRLLHFGKLSLASICFTVALHGSASAQFSGSAKSNVTTVEEARTARVGSRVSLTGSLKKEVGERSICSGMRQAIFAFGSSVNFGEAER